MLGISDQQIDVIQNFVEDQGITFPVLKDAGSQVYRDYNVPGGQSPYPRDFIIDRDGIIRFADTEYDPGTMITVVESLIEEETSAAVTEEPVPTPRSLSISSIYPNPFNAEVTIEVTLERTQEVFLDIYDLSGRWIDRLHSGSLAAGVEKFRWNGETWEGRSASSGVYLVLLKGVFFTDRRKLVVLK